MSSISPAADTANYRLSRSYTGNDPVRNFRFIVSFFPTAYAKAKKGTGWTPEGRIGFNSVSGLSVSLEAFQIREGGYNTTYHQIPTQIAYSPVTFQRGVLLGSSQHWDWFRNFFSVLQGKRSAADDGSVALFRADVEVSVLHYPIRYANGSVSYGGQNIFESQAAFDDSVAMRFRLYNCWPSSVAYSDLNASDSALMVEQVTLVHEGLDLLWSNYDPNGVPEGTLPSAPQF